MNNEEVKKEFMEKFEGSNISSGSSLSTKAAEELWNWIQTAINKAVEVERKKTYLSEQMAFMQIKNKLQSELNSPKG